MTVNENTDLIFRREINYEGKSEKETVTSSIERTEDVEKKITATFSSHRGSGEIRNFTLKVLFHEF